MILARDTQTNTTKYNTFFGGGKYIVSFHSKWRLLHQGLTPRRLVESSLGVGKMCIYRRRGAKGSYYLTLVRVADRIL